MTKLARPSNPGNATATSRTFFVTTQTAGRRRIFQTERMANLLIDVLRDQMRAKHLFVHDFVVMPDHVHLLITVPAESTIERAMQLIKGVFSFRAGRELSFRGEIWQRGFSDVLVADEQSFRAHKEYIDKNPVRAGLARSPEEYPYGSACLTMRKSAGAEARSSIAEGRHD
jgi:putative transposase